MAKKEKVGEDFERAVYDFASRLDPGAEVLFDHDVPDRDTGEMRQCDVWINTKIGGHYPISILVSCKDHGRKLDVGAIGTFCDEVRSTSASTGIIYARSGFTKPALLKAKANGISCCRLYRNEPGDLPASINVSCYFSNPAIHLAVNQARNLPPGLTYGHLFNLPVSLPDGRDGSVLDLMLDKFHEDLLDEAEKAAEARGLPKRWANSLRLGDEKGPFSCTVWMQGSWKHYKGIARATLLNGSYCFTDDSFCGRITPPRVHEYNAYPGEDWEQVEPDVPIPRNALFAVVSRDIRQMMTDYFGPIAVDSPERSDASDS